MRSGFEFPYLAWSRPADGTAKHSEPVSIKALEQEWQANAEALRRRGLFRLVRGTAQQPPLSVA